MTTAILVHPDFDRDWPLAASPFADAWQGQGEVTFLRLHHSDRRALDEVVPNPERVTRLVSLGIPATAESLGNFAGLQEAAFSPALPQPTADRLASRGVTIYRHPSEGYWGQSVAECALALTLCGLRRIPDKHRAIIEGLGEWDYRPPQGQGIPGGRGTQFGDDPRFVNGTVAGKRVRVVGAGNIGSRYAAFTRMLGAEVAAWDPYASEPSFHRAGSRREWHLERLVADAEIFAPMLPLTETTEGLITRRHIEALPRGCLVVLATRAGICDMAAIRERVLADELSLAADVFDIEPLPLDDPLLGRHNVVHTPHLAGRTADANRLWATQLIEQFRPVDGQS